MGIPVLRGRTFDARDKQDAPPAFVVNEELAARYFPGEEALGKRITYPWEVDVSGEIVGVVGSVREMGPMAEPSPAIYRTVEQMPASRMAVVIRSDGDPQALIAGATAVVREIDPNQPVAQVRTMEQEIGRASCRGRV